MRALHQFLKDTFGDAANVVPANVPAMPVGLPQTTAQLRDLILLLAQTPPDLVIETARVVMQDSQHNHTELLVREAIILECLYSMAPQM
jgi:hypothetical protein